MATRAWRPRAANVRDDPDPDPRVGQAPERFGGVLDDGHRAEDPVVGHGDEVQSLEVLRGEVPFREVPGPLEWELLLLDAQLVGDDGAKSARVVATDAVEVHAEDIGTFHPQHGSGPPATGQPAVRPASTERIAPWTCRASSEARKAKKAAMSSGRDISRRPM